MYHDGNVEKKKTFDMEQNKSVIGLAFTVRDVWQAYPALAAMQS